ncbi:AraC family transcriptional regulator [Eubacteriales bacterium OttesenSCG-928-A19]|nr:AraC family transcriptional regulator [Eubacteriales bacterium OttesenSCG-928-A19]
MEWLKNLSRAIDYIEQNLEGEILYDQAAQIACCSVFYFQRVFSYVAGVSVSEYIRRRRMTLAAFELQKGNTKVQDVGAKYHYVSPASFNRAFQAVHGVTPSAAKIPGTQLNAYPKLGFSINVTGGESMKYRIEKKDATQVVGVHTSLVEDDVQNRDICASFWRSCARDGSLSRIVNLDTDPAKQILGISYYKNTDDVRYYIAAESNTEAPEDMEVLLLPASEWAVFSCNGRFPQTVQDAYKQFYTEWLPFSGYQVPQMADMEIYPVTDTLLESGIYELWIAVEKEG